MIEYIVNLSILLVVGVVLGYILALFGYAVYTVAKRRIYV